MGREGKEGGRKRGEGGRKRSQRDEQFATKGGRKGMSTVAGRGRIERAVSNRSHPASMLLILFILQII